MRKLKTVTEPLKGFKAFVMRGNAIDLAIGVTVGAAFTAVIKAFVDKVITPLMSLPGKFNYDNLSVCVKHPPHMGCGPDSGISIAYGAVISAFVTFVITAAAVYFVFLRPITRLREGYKDPTTKPCPECLSEIPVEAKRCRACGVELLVP